MKVKEYWFLRLGADSAEEALLFRTRIAAIHKYQRVAQELERYGQELGASLHRAPNRYTLNEYPDYVLALGPRGGVSVERA
jgi:hypothetical protein